MGKRPSSDIETAHGPYLAPPPPSPQFFCPPQSKSWCSWLVPLIFAADIAIFVYSMYVNNCPSTTGADKCLLSEYLGRFSFQPFHENPLLGPSVSTLKSLGALDWKMVVDDNEGWRFLSCIWLHAGIIHLGANMMSLLFIGIRLEQEFGFLKIGLLYVLSGFGGSLMSAIKAKQQTPMISVGASGALFGLLGAMLSELITNWTIYANKCAALMTLVMVIVLNLAVGFLPHVDSSAHIGGFLSGFLLGFILLIHPQYGYVSRKHIPPGFDMKHKKPKHKCYQYMLWIIAFVSLLLSYALGLARLYGIEKLPKNYVQATLPTQV